jgi:hypothetical protein
MDFEKLSSIVEAELDKGIKTASVTEEKKKVTEKDLKEEAEKIANVDVKTEEEEKLSFEELDLEKIANLLSGTSVEPNKLIKEALAFINTELSDSGYQKVASSVIEKELKGSLMVKMAYAIHNLSKEKEKDQQEKETKKIASKLVSEGIFGEEEACEYIKKASTKLNNDREALELHIERLVEANNLKIAELDDETLENDNAIQKFENFIMGIE